METRHLMDGLGKGAEEIAGRGCCYTYFGQLLRSRCGGSRVLAPGALHTSVPLHVFSYPVTCIPQHAPHASTPLRASHTSPHTPHAHNTLQVVLVVGASNSGSDISREIAGVASRVLVAARNWTPDAGVGKSSRPYGERANIYR
eukprot:365349-Chlamydomonas_euryale.AAC.3